jgi:pimeloyl-ACP methyl ester carboxylesterase
MNSFNLCGNRLKIVFLFIMSVKKLTDYLFMKIPVLQFILFLAVTSVSLPAQPYLIGHRTMNFTDPSRNDRPVPSEVYYPATTAGNNTSFAEGAFPVIVFGHGFLMTYDAYLYLKDALVPLGYIITFTKTEGGASPNHAEYGADLAFLINQMKTEGTNVSSPFYLHIDSTSAIMGHSMGGGASFLACANNHVPTAMITFAAAETNPSAIAAASDITIPSLVFAADEDCVTPPPQHQVPMYDSLACDCKVYISIKGGGHCYFGDYNFLCSLGEVSCQQNFTITRVQQHAVILDFLVPYLNYTLKNDASSWILFNDSLASSSRITYEKSCTTTQLNNPGNNQQCRIFPSPASDHVFIDLPGNQEKTIQIIIRSISGNVVLTQICRGISQNRQNKIDISALPPGYFFIEIISGKNHFYQSLIKGNSLD